MAATKRLDLGNLNPIYERELTELDVHRGEVECVLGGHFPLQQMERF